VILLAVSAAAEPLAKIEAGPYEVKIIEALDVTDPVQEKTLALRILYPDGEGPFPLVVFSSGAFCLPQLYDLVTSHWASHGYVVIVPNHYDSPNNGKPDPATFSLFLPSRIREVTFVVDDLEVIATQAGLTGKIDGNRIAAAGHSFGAVIAMTKIGLNLEDGAENGWGEAEDSRFQAAVLMSAPGKGDGPSGMEVVADNAYDGLDKPFMATGGTNDVGRVDPGEMTAAEWRTMVYRLAPPGDKYAVITEGSDHYHGGLICNADRGGDPDPEGVAIVAAMTTMFLDAYIKDDKAAMDYLKTVDVPARTEGRATYQSR
jgi:pimeloyl-ACP methyl ester carboxylesterase